MPKKKVRKKQRKRRVSSSSGGARTPNRSQPARQPAAKTTRYPWGWISGIVVVVAVVGAIVWFTAGPGKPEPPTPTVTPLPTITPTPTVAATPTESAKTERGAVPMPENPAERNNMYSAPPAMQIDPKKSYIATLQTARGDIVVELFADKVPRTVNNFVFLAREGFYDNTTFHRVISGFMAQAGDPTGTGAGGPGYRFEDEFHPDLKHDQPGILSMANSGANTNGSQFFITYEATSWLDAYDANGQLKDCASRNVSCHAVFGRVIEGMDVLRAITPRDPAQATTPGDLIRTIRIEER